MAMGTVMAMVRKIQRRRSRNNFFPMAWFQKENKQYFFYEHDMHSHILPGLDDRGVGRYREKDVGIGSQEIFFYPSHLFSFTHEYPGDHTGQVELTKGMSFERRDFFGCGRGGGI